MSGVGASTTRRFSFSAGHRYWVAAWSDAENRRVFGALTVPHGHNYILDVTVRGPVDERADAHAVREAVRDLQPANRVGERREEVVVDPFLH